ncbi:hypothetical protein K0U00_43460, partial [Paenibacillus sepulcri]|nr:hypothetical protein [Paenibacillus sepulcri]
VLAYVNLAKPETRSLVIELEQQLFGRELTMQDVSYIPLMKTEINRILAVFQADPQPAAAQAVQKQAADLSEQASRGQGALWIGSIALISSFFLIVSLHITGRPLGLLVNERNLISLSRFQTLLWTIMLLSAYYSAASLRIYGLQDIGNALNIAMDWHLWALMGISFTSLVATPLIHTTKQAKTISPDEADKLQPADVEGSDGILYANANFSDASWTDMFKGEEVKNVNIVDMAKLQMFFFTIIAAASYA